jgi:hypothetical protein
VIADKHNLCSLLPGMFDKALHLPCGHHPGFVDNKNIPVCEHPPALFNVEKTPGDGLAFDTCSSFNIGYSPLFFKNVGRGGGYEHEKWGCV